MEQQPCGLACQAAGPYPPVDAGERNARYAEMILSNVGGAVSEMTAAALYFYDALAAADLPEVAEVFRRISVVEMRHLDIFGTLARQLGADPRLWCGPAGRRSWWTPRCISYAPKLAPLLRAAIRSETAAIQKYETQRRVIRNPNVAANLERILQDERLHLDAFRCLWETYGGPAEAYPGR